MAPPAPGRTVSMISLAVTAVVVVVMAMWGYRAMTAPVADDTTITTPTDDPQSCSGGQVATIVEFVRRGEVVVSVYNAGKKAGRARSTLDKLEAAGFRPGAIGNAPDGTDVVRAQVRAKAADATAAKLVAAALGKHTAVDIAGPEEDLGPGVNVFIGDRFHNLDPNAPARLRLPKARIECS